MTSKILIIAGEASGDLHGANLVKSIKKTKNDVEFFGIGGQQMQLAGVHVFKNAAKIAVVGLFEILRHWQQIRSAFKLTNQIISNQHLDLVILIDYPGFNLRIAKKAKKAGIKVLYYISPQLWAWHKSRIKTIKKYVDQMAVVFPFEEIFYQKENVSAKFVGHPLLDVVKPRLDKQTVYNKLKIDNNKLIIGLLPGSRLIEIKRLLPIILKSAVMLKKTYPDIQFILPLAPTLSQNDIQPYLSKYELPIKVVSNNFYDALNICQAAIVASGTATLELALLKVPMVMIYKINPLTYFLGRNLVNLNTFGICNILSDKKIIQELIQNDVKPANITKEIKRIVEDMDYKSNMIDNLRKIKMKLLADPNNINAADLAINLLEKK